MLYAGRSRLLYVVLLCLVVALLFSGCSKKKPPEVSDKTYPENLPPPPEVDDALKPGDVSTLPLETVEGETAPAPTDLGTPLADPLRMEADQKLSELRTVYFDFDSYALTGQTKSDLEGNYDWLSSHPGIHVLIEGHCDERGTVEYNLNLGQKRADAVREYLILKGLDPSTLHTISYGEERPEVDGNDESAWSRNRRVQFLVY